MEFTNYTACLTERIRMNIIRFVFVLASFASLTIIPGDKGKEELPTMPKINVITENLPEPIKTIAKKASRTFSEEIL